MAEKITYILGAGASIGTFPLVKESDVWRGQGLADILLSEGNKLKRSNLGGKAYDLTLLKIAEAMIDVGTKSKTAAFGFGNVDTYAHYLYNREQSKLHNLKMALTYYFVRQQVCKHYFTPTNEGRYLHFMTSLLQGGEFPSNIKILNWNYDFLFERAAMVYNPQKLYVNHAIVQSEPKPFVEYFPPIGIAPSNLNYKYSVVHLNGIAGMYQDSNDWVASFFRNIIVELLDGDIHAEISEERLLNYFHEKLSQTDHLITFAWEIQSVNKKVLPSVLDIAKETIQGTSILVVIGYSFPPYNTAYDNAIFSSMKPTLEKIYFQDPYIDAEFLRERFDLKTRGHKKGIRPGFGDYPDRSSDGVDLKHVSKKDMFYVPVEFYS